MVCQEQWQKNKLNQAEKDGTALAFLCGCAACVYFFITFIVCFQQRISKYLLLYSTHRFFFCQSEAGGKK